MAGVMKVVPIGEVWKCRPGLAVPPEPGPPPAGGEEQPQPSVGALQGVAELPVQLQGGAAPEGGRRGCAGVPGGRTGGWGPGTLDHTGAFMEVRFVGRGGPVGGGGEGGSLAGGRMETPRLVAPEGQAG